MRIEVSGTNISHLVVVLHRQAIPGVDQPVRCVDLTLRRFCFSHARASVSAMLKTFVPVPAEKAGFLVENARKPFSPADFESRPMFQACCAHASASRQIFRASSPYWVPGSSWKPIPEAAGRVKPAVAGKHECLPATAMGLWIRCRYFSFCGSAPVPFSDAVSDSDMVPDSDLSWAPVPSAGLPPSAGAGAGAVPGR